MLLIFSNALIFACLIMFLSLIILHLFTSTKVDQLAGEWVIGIILKCIKEVVKSYYVYLKFDDIFSLLCRLNFFAITFHIPHNLFSVAFLNRRF